MPLLCCHGLGGRSCAVIHNKTGCPLIAVFHLPEYYAPMLNHTLVSVVMPTYNRPYFVRTRSIPSVLRQTHTNWELIVVGDGPEDDSTRRVVEAVGDRRVRYCEIARPDYSNLTPRQFWHVAGAAARNYALDIARGDIICPLDDDDEFLPSHLEDCVRALANSAYDVVYGPVLLRNLEIGREIVDSVPRAADDQNIIYHSSVGIARKVGHLRYPTDGLEPDDFGLWRLVHNAGGKFGRLSRVQSINYGESLVTRYRLSIPSIPTRDSSFDSDVRQILDSCWLSNSGPYCCRFESAISSYVDCPFVCTPSGDLALTLAFAALREVLGDCGKNEVIVPSYTHPSTVNSLLWSGFEPIFCDVDPDTLCVTPEIVQPLLGPEVAAILPVYAHGNSPDSVRLEQLAKDRHVALVGDASAAFGATIGSRRAGSFGDMEIFSFSGTKVLTTGEGGGVCCNNQHFESVVRRLGRYGISDNYECQSKGLNGKMAEIPAALGLANLESFDDSLQDRRRAAQRYRNGLSTLPGIRLQHAFSPSAVGVEKDLAIICDSAGTAQALAKSLDAYRVDTRPYYRPLHPMKPFARFRRGDLAVTERLKDSVLCVPLYNRIRDEVVDMIVGMVMEHCAVPRPKYSPLAERAESASIRHAALR